MADCEQCGNPTSELVCPFCGYQQSVEAIKERRRSFHVVNVKQGNPPVHEAQQRLLDGHDKALQNGADAMVVVHGYGSSGRGGEIGRAIRRTLEQWCAAGRVEAVHHGENITLTRDWRKRFPGIERELGRGNEGATLVDL